jgi:hypothetical protein
MFITTSVLELYRYEAEKEEQIKATLVAQQCR